MLQALRGTYSSKIHLYAVDSFHKVIDFVRGLKEVPQETSNLRFVEVCSGEMQSYIQDLVSIE